MNFTTQLLADTTQHRKEQGCELTFEMRKPGAGTDGFPSDPTAASNSALMGIISQPDGNRDFIIDVHSPLPGAGCGVSHMVSTR
jgi:hypothetical protein